MSATAATSAAALFNSSKQIVSNSSTISGGFNQPIMCGSEPRVKAPESKRKSRSSFLHNPNMHPKTWNGVDWDGPYKLPFQVPKAWNFFTEGLAEELSKEGARDKAIFPDTNIVVTRCAMIGNLTGKLNCGWR